MMLVHDVHAVIINAYRTCTRYLVKYKIVGIEG